MSVTSKPTSLGRQRHVLSVPNCRTLCEIDGQVSRDQSGRAFHALLRDEVFDACERLTGRERRSQVVGGAEVQRPDARIDFVRLGDHERARFAVARDPTEDPLRKWVAVAEVYDHDVGPATDDSLRDPLRIVHELHLVRGLRQRLRDRSHIAAFRCDDHDIDPAWPLRNPEPLGSPVLHRLRVPETRR